MSRSALRFGIGRCAANSSLRTFDLTVVTLTFASWNLIYKCLRQIERFLQEKAALAPASAGRSDVQRGNRQALTVLGGW
jgi:hypothetical protein